MRRKWLRSTAFFEIFFGTIKEIFSLSPLINLKVKEGEVIDLPLRNICSTSFVFTLLILESIACPAVAWVKRSVFFGPFVGGVKAPCVRFWFWIVPKIHEIWLFFSFWVGMFVTYSRVYNIIWNKSNILSG